LLAASHYRQRLRCGSGTVIAITGIAMGFLEEFWMKALNLVEQGIVRSTYLSAAPPNAMRVVAPLVVIGLLSAVSRTVFRAAHYVAFTAVCGAAFYFLLRTL
tara:strand:- start:793 stop:1098 length:306 start_codon:yes stop_codon:yes gene_type:complete